MKLTLYSLFLSSILALLTLSCSDKEDDPLRQNEVSSLSFSWDFEDDATYMRTYDLAFLTDDLFEFSASSHHTDGEQIGKLVGDYILSDDAVVFNYGARGFLVKTSYVKPLSGILERNAENKIVGIRMIILHERFNGTTYTSKLPFYLSDYQPTTKDPGADLQKFNEKDLRGTAWEMRIPGVTRKNVILCNDHTTFGFGESWTFDEKSLVLTIMKDSQPFEYKIRSGNKDEFEAKMNDDTYTWTRIPDNDLHSYYGQFISGAYTCTDGRTLTIPGLSGTAAPALPNSSKMNKYETQEMIFDYFDGLKGTYHMHYEGQTWDISKYIPWAWNREGGTIEISDPLKTNKNFKVILSGKINGEFIRD